MNFLSFATLCIVLVISSGPTWALANPRSAPAYCKVEARLSASISDSVVNEKDSWIGNGSLVCHLPSGPTVPLPMKVCFVSSYSHNYEEVDLDLMGQFQVIIQLPQSEISGNGRVASYSLSKNKASDLGDMKTLLEMENWVGANNSSSELSRQMSVSFVSSASDVNASGVESGALAVVKEGKKCFDNINGPGIFLAD